MREEGKKGEMEGMREKIERTEELGGGEDAGKRGGK